MKTLITVGVGAVMALTLTGCTRGSSLQPQENTQRLTSTTVVLPDGREVDCVFNLAGGVDCDYDELRVDDE